MALINGDDYVSGDLESYQQNNRLKNHWRLNIADLTNPSEGMIKSTPVTNLLEHCIADSTPGPIVWVEIVQGDIPLSDDIEIIRGNNSDCSDNYDESINDAWIFGVPVDPKRGVIWCDKADIGVDFTGIIDASAFVQHHIVDNDNDSTFDWGFWADDVGLLTVPANPLREQMLMNSQFGVWSQSDANKGLAELVFDNGTVAPVVGEAIVGALATGKVIWVDVTNDDWAGGNGAGTCYLGAVTGAYIDNETIVGSVAASFDVNGDLDIGVKNDPCNDNSVASWTLEGAGIVLAFVAAEYSVTTTAINQRAWIANAPLLAGHIYKIELDINDGTAAGVDIEGYFDDGAAQYGRIETTAAGWASVSWVFECATNDANGDVGFRIPANLAGGNIQVRRFSCYEITPCCTAVDTVALDGWYKHNSLDIYRQHWDATYTKDGSFYSLKMVPTEAIMDSYVRFPGAFYDNEEWYAQFQGRTVALGAWIYTSANNHCRIRIIDSVGNESSDWHPGDGAWHWLEVVRTIDVAAVSLEFRITAEGAAEVDGDSIIYVSQPMLVFGASIGEGNYRPRQQEVLYTETFISSNLLDTWQHLSSIAWTTLNIEADSDAKLPKGAKAIFLYWSCRDSGSAANDCYVRFRADPIVPSGTSAICSLYGLANDSWGRTTAWQSCDNDGDFQYDISASAANTFDFSSVYYNGIQLN